MICNNCYRETSGALSSNQTPTTVYVNPVYGAVSANDTRAMNATAVVANHISCPWCGKDLFGQIVAEELAKRGQNNPAK